MGQTTGVVDRIPFARVLPPAKWDGPGLIRRDGEDILWHRAPFKSGFLRVHHSEFLMPILHEDTSWSSGNEENIK